MKVYSKDIIDKITSTFSKEMAAEIDKNIIDTIMNVNEQTGIHIVKYTDFQESVLWQYSQYAVVGEEQKDGKIKTAYVKYIDYKEYEDEILTEQEFKEKYFIKAL